MHPRAAADDAYVAELEEKEDELATQIRHASKDIYGTKDHYDLRGKSVEELDIMSQDAHLQSTLRGQNVGKIAIAYTVWSKKKGGGKLIVKEVFNKIKKSNHLNRLVTLSPLTDMAYKFHIKNGAKLISVNETTQNFEYKVIKSKKY